MRDYGRLSSAMWTRGSGKRIRGNFAAQAVACYLASAPGSNMLGLYHITLATIASEMGHPVEAVREALAACASADLAYYDEDAELAWIPNVAGIELGDGLAVADKRRKGIEKHLASLGKHRFVRQFVAKYGVAFNLSVGRDAPEASPPTPPYSAEYAGNIPPYNGAGAGAGAGAGEGVQGVQGVQVDDAPTAAPRPTNLGFLGSERGWWTDAMRAATKNPGYVAPSPRDLGQLLEFVHAGAPGANAAESERWLREAVAAFVAATSTRRKFYPIDKLSGFARWIADNRPTREQLDARDTVTAPTTAYEATARARADTGYTAPAMGPSDATFRKQRAEAVPMPPMNTEDIFRPKTNPDPEPTEGAV